MNVRARFLVLTLCACLLVGASGLSSLHASLSRAAPAEARTRTRAACRVNVVKSPVHVHVYALGTAPARVSAARGARTEHHKPAKTTRPQPPATRAATVTVRTATARRSPTGVAATRVHDLRTTHHHQNQNRRRATLDIATRHATPPCDALRRLHLSTLREH